MKDLIIVFSSSSAQLNFMSSIDCSELLCDWKTSIQKVSGRDTISYDEDFLCSRLSNIKEKHENSSKARRLKLTVDERASNEVVERRKWNFHELVSRRSVSRVVGKTSMFVKNKLKMRLSSSNS